uniref:SJCHGC09628 protein n=1 Tax=Schistosoma japonicum TaxID=6182 RepID=Q5DA10_SCHJA|nr:SJCHGC09628 protein [Schistosoma japonicum]
MALSVNYKLMEDSQQHFRLKQPHFYRFHGLLSDLQQKKKLLPQAQQQSLDECLKSPVDPEKHSQQNAVREQQLQGTCKLAYFDVICLGTDPTWSSIHLWKLMLRLKVCFLLEFAKWFVQRTLKDDEKG